jgi:hypothetical protein
MATIKVWGDQEPDFQMNSFNEIVFQQQLSFRMLVHWKQGGENVVLTNLQSDFGGTSPDWDADANGNHIPDGLDRIMKIGSSAVNSVKSSSYLRFREIGLYYSFNKLPGNIVKKYTGRCVIEQLLHYHKLSKLRSGSFKFWCRIFFRRGCSSLPFVQKGSVSFNH